MADAGRTRTPPASASVRTCRHVARSELPHARHAKADHLHALTPLLHIRFAGLQKVLVISKLRM
jgi:hypothetical protein